MAKGKGKSFNQKLNKILGILALAAPIIYEGTKTGSVSDKAIWIVNDYTGFNMASGKFEPGKLAVGWGPSIGLKAVRVGMSLLNSLL